MQKTILIFGAGDNQLTLIKAARELRVKSIVIDPNPDAPGKGFADVFEVVAPNDYIATKEVALKYKVDGIVTSQMENPLRLMAKLATEQGYIFPSPEVIERSRNKYLMKQAFIDRQIPCARGILVKEGEAIKPENLQGYNYPLIIKPADAHSSRGVYRITSYDELLYYEHESRMYSSDKSILIEEFIRGSEYSIEAITYKGKTTIIQYTEKIITPYPRTVELGHIQPAKLTDKQKKEIDTIVTNAIAALGIDNSATHTELKLSENGPVIIEIGARLGGDYISSYLTMASTGVNMDKAAIQVALGIQPEINNKKVAFSYIKYLELEPGSKIKYIGEWKSYLSRTDIVYANITAKEGNVVPLISDSSKRSGFVIISAPSRTEAINKANAFAKQLLSLIKLN